MSDLVRRLSRLMLVPLALAVAADAMAQFGGGGMGGMGGGMRGSRGSRDRSASPEPRQPKEAPASESGVILLEQTIEELRTDLRLQPTQIPAWEAYIARARLLASDLSRERMQSTAATQTSALKRIDRSIDAARNRLAALEEVADSAKAFYALLTPEQQMIADPRLAALVPGPGGTYASRLPGSMQRPPQSMDSRN